MPVITRPNFALLHIFVATVFILTDAWTILVAAKLIRFDALPLSMVELAIVVSLAISLLLESLKRLGRSTRMTLKFRISV